MSLQTGIHDAQVKTDAGGETFAISCRVEDDGSGSGHLTVTKDGAVLQSTDVVVGTRDSAHDEH
jgi:hypothetical protein